MVLQKNLDRKFIALIMCGLLLISQTTIAAKDGNRCSATFSDRSADKTATTATDDRFRAVRLWQRVNALPVSLRQVALAAGISNSNLTVLRKMAEASEVGKSDPSIRGGLSARTLDRIERALDDKRLTSPEFRLIEADSYRPPTISSVTYRIEIVAPVDSTSSLYDAKVMLILSGFENLPPPEWGGFYLDQWAPQGGQIESIIVEKGSLSLPSNQSFLQGRHITNLLAALRTEGEQGELTLGITSAFTRENENLFLHIPIYPETLVKYLNLELVVPPGIEPRELKVGYNPIRRDQIAFTPKSAFSGVRAIAEEKLADGSTIYSASISKPLPGLWALYWHGL